jgi:hypothetical protein
MNPTPSPQLEQAAQVVDHAIQAGVGTMALLILLILAFGSMVALVLYLRFYPTISKRRDESDKRASDSLTTMSNMYMQTINAFTGLRGSFDNLNAVLAQSTAVDQQRIGIDQQRMEVDKQQTEIISACLKSVESMRRELVGAAEIAIQDRARLEDKLTGLSAETVKHREAVDRMNAELMKKLQDLLPVVTDLKTVADTVAEVRKSGLEHLDIGRKLYVQGEHLTEQLTTIEKLVRSVVQETKADPPPVPPLDLTKVGEI